MTERILDLSEEAAALHVRLAQLVMEHNSGQNVAVRSAIWLCSSFPIPDVTYSQSVLCGITEPGGIFVACNGKRAPIGMLLPLESHYVQTERFQEQAHASAPQQKRIWQQIVRAKVCAQGRLLERLHGDDAGLLRLAQHYRYHRLHNIEAQASRRYWPSLFADPHFRRDRNAEDQNRLLNYGYAVLRALTARAACAAGLHPHSASTTIIATTPTVWPTTLMEPFRPMVDVADYLWYRSQRAERPRLISQIGHRGILLAASASRRQSRTLFDILARMASSLADVFLRQSEELEMLLLVDAKWLRQIRSTFRSTMECGSLRCSICR